MRTSQVLGLGCARRPTSRPSPTSLDLLLFHIHILDLKDGNGNTRSNCKNDTTSSCPGAAEEHIQTSPSVKSPELGT